MDFTSLNFTIFIVCLLTLYWTIGKKSKVTQNILLLLGSGIFYFLIGTEFLILIALSALANFFFAKGINYSKSDTRRLVIFYSGITFNLGILLYFKYWNFFVSNINQLMSFGGSQASFGPFEILMPLGISFLTFQMIGYLIDVNNQEVQPSNNVVEFLTYYFYFPKVFGGPIERYQIFTPQITNVRKFSRVLFVDGLKQFLWGAFKKIVIANTVMPIVDQVFSNYTSVEGGTLFIGAISFIIALYADFSGYSDMACGLSKLVGIRITNNFSFPFFSTSTASYWKKWHISLTTWMMDYVFTPLSFYLRGYKKVGLIISIFLTFVIIGIWHGANWTFVIFGLLHGIYFIPSLLLTKKKVHKNRGIEVIKTVLVFLLIALTAVVFKSENMQQAIAIYHSIFSKSITSFSHIFKLESFVLMAILLIFDFFGKKGEYAIQSIGLKTGSWYRYSLYFVLILSFLYYSYYGSEYPFVYFQF